MYFTIDKDKYYSVFQLNTAIKLKNIVFIYKNHKNQIITNITNSNNNLKIKELKHILSVSCSTHSNTKIDVTIKTIRYYTVNYYKNISDISDISDISYIFDELNNMMSNFLRIYLSYFSCKTNDSNINLHARYKAFDRNTLIHNFFRDAEHGFFHGLVASFICYTINCDGELINKADRVSNLKDIFMSATLHDFLKANGVEQQLHDKELVKVYPNLLEETYCHSDPPEKFYNKHLIIADRLELRRYPDYKKWVDKRFHHLYSTMSLTTKKTLNLFYTIIRPCMEYNYLHNNIIITDDKNFDIYKVRIFLMKTLKL